MTDTYSPVPELNLLKEFDAGLGNTYFSQSFELIAYGDTSGVDTWSDHPEFLARILPFAQANGSGSLYALWRVDDREDLADLPVVAFGDEGGVHLAARTLRELFRILACDRYAYVFIDGITFSSREEDEEDERGSGEAHERYVAWLWRQFGLDPAEEPDDVVIAADEEYGERFAAWMDQYVEGFAAEYAELTAG